MRRPSRGNINVVSLTSFKYTQRRVIKAGLRTVNPITLKSRDTLQRAVLSFGASTDAAISWRICTGTEFKMDLWEPWEEQESTSSSHCGHDCHGDWDTRATREVTSRESNLWKVTNTAPPSGTPEQPTYYRTVAATAVIPLPDRQYVSLMTCATNAITLAGLPVPTQRVLVLEVNCLLLRLLSYAFLF